MEIRSTLTNSLGQVLDVVYKESDPTLDLEGRVLDGVHAYCFYGDKLVVVYADKTQHWSPPGGAIEFGETWQEATIREIKEETNMKVLHYELIGYQDIFEPDRIIRQTRTFCIVEPYGDFVVDPDGDITEIKLIDPQDYKKYFNWGIVGEHIIKRVLELKDKHNH